MPTKVDYEKAGSVLEDALERAMDEKTLPVQWVSLTRSVFALDSKTWTPALATMLLAKSVNSQIDAMSLKVDPENENSYSARSLCHGVIVPAAIEHNFSIRNTGREPLNNQPFFRYMRIDELDRVKNPADRDFFVDVAKMADALSSQDAEQALSAFLKVALDTASKVQSVKIKSGSLTPSGAQNAAEDFLRSDASDRPRRLQAFAAACLDLAFPEVKARRINDPSVDLPGDVHVLSGPEVTHAIEVRGKPVTASELASFVRACSNIPIGRAFMFVDSDEQLPLNVGSLMRSASQTGMQVAIFTSIANLLATALLWANSSIEEATERFANQMLERLREIEVPVGSLEEWTRAVALSQSRQS